MPHMLPYFVTYDPMNDLQHSLDYVTSACKQIYYWCTHHLNNLWLAGSPKLHSWAFLPLDRASAQRFTTTLSYSRHTITKFSWHLSNVLQWVPPSFNRWTTAIVLSVWKELVFLLIASSNIWQAIHTVSSIRIVMWVSLPFLRLPASKWKIVMWPPQSSFEASLWLPPLLRVCVLILTVAWRCATNVGLWLPLSLASAPLIDWLESCNSHLARIVGAGV